MDRYPRCKFILALIQLRVTRDKAVNVERACEKIAEARERRANIVALPECFNSPYGTEYFSHYAEPIPDGKTSCALSKAARQNKVYVIAGSIPEQDGEHIYNTCTVYNPEGCLIAKYRKSHLVVIDIPGMLRNTEADTLSPGNELVSFDTPFCRIGLGICYDLRFPKMATKYAEKGCDLLVYPCVFNMVTGPMHWEILTRSRALDNQLFVATINPSRDEKQSVIAYGHSMVANPWGGVIASAKEQEEIVTAEIDPDLVLETRHQLPLHRVQRSDLY